jgi:UDP-N-acetylmuramate dehydrogenase
MVQLSEAVPLAARCTLGLGGPARRFATVTKVGEIVEALDEAGDDPVLVLGGGSNLVVRDGGFPGLVIRIAIPGVTIREEGDHALVSAFAGVVWDDFVAQMVDAKLAGVECLSGIPGLVGATPMQNVGAYGQEVADTIELVRVLDRDTGEIESFDPAACAFAYRSSIFKGSERWVMLEVRFKLKKTVESAPIKYAELSKALGIAPGGTAPLGVVRDTVIRLRRGKGMVVDPGDPDSRSAGSFFMNPIVDTDTMRTLGGALPLGTTIPHWVQPDGRVKLAAGWLIERAGFTKGMARGNVGISSKHALALVTRDGATTAELLALAAEIQAGVKAKLGIELHPEPIIVGV